MPVMRSRRERAPRPDSLREVRFTHERYASLRCCCDRSRRRTAITGGRSTFCNFNCPIISSSMPHPPAFKEGRAFLAGLEQLRNRRLNFPVHIRSRICAPAGKNQPLAKTPTQRYCCVHASCFYSSFHQWPACPPARIAFCDAPRVSRGVCHKS